MDIHHRLYFGLIVLAQADRDLDSNLDRKRLRESQNVITDLLSKLEFYEQQCVRQHEERKQTRHFGSQWFSTGNVLSTMVISVIIITHGLSES